MFCWSRYCEDLSKEDDLYFGRLLSFAESKSDLVNLATLESFRKKTCQIRTRFAGLQVGIPGLRDNWYV
jgi:hypothetical protein